MTAGNCFSQIEGDSNRVDEKGLKQGFWVVNYPDSGMMYQGYFIDDRPAKLMKRYHKNGEIKLTFIFFDNNKACAAHIFYKDSVLRAQGIYREEKKDSTWIFYNEEGMKVAEENYDMGVKIGLSVSFFKDNKPYEKINWKNGEKHGPWNQYFENGKQRVTGNYIDGQLQGETIFYNVDGTVSHKGMYKDNVKHGMWFYYEEDGSPKIKLDYNMGHIKNQDEYDAFMKKKEEENNKR